MNNQIFVGPFGSLMTIDDLPSPSTKRWVIRRKAEVVAAVQAGVMTLKQACKRYSLSEEEFESWEKSIKRHGLLGLRTTKTKLYRHKDNLMSDDTLLSFPKASNDIG